MAKKSNVNIPVIQIIRVIVFLFIGYILFIAYIKVYDFMTASELFAVQEVVVDSSIQFIDVSDLRRLKGRNIFKVDIAQLQAKIKAQYPQIAQLRVIKELPNRIKVLAQKRDALFQTPWRGKILLVDGKGVAMYYISGSVDLPVVQGALLGHTKVILGTPQMGFYQ